MRHRLQRTGRNVSQQRLAAALTKLSRLAWRTSTLRFSPPGAAERLTMLFLKQLVALCEAQQGALFVAPGHPYDAMDTLQPAWSLLTNVDMNEADARLALATFVPGSDQFQWSADPPATLFWQRLCTPKVNLDEAHATMTRLPLVVLLLRWPATEQRMQASVQQQAMQLLSLFTHLIDTILLHVLTARYAEKPPPDVFPAELLATVGHELRSPLTTIQGYATTLLRHDQHITREERQDFLQAISEASTHLSTIVERCLTLAQFETQIFPSSTLHAVNMLMLAQESIIAVKECRPSHLLLIPPGAERATGESSFQDAVTVSGDRRLLRMLLDILLENALAYSAPESLIEIALEPMAAASLATSTPMLGSGKPSALILPATFQEQDSLLEIRVRDQGIGIPPEHLFLIFHRFYRVDTRLTREVNGLGLGLALCKAIVAQHQGMLWVESVEREGSTFHIVLPLGAKTFVSQY